MELTAIMSCCEHHGMIVIDARSWSINAIVVKAVAASSELPMITVSVIKVAWVGTNVGRR